MNLGAAEFQSGETDAGVSEFQEALRLNPHSFNVHNNLGIMYLVLGRPEEAIAQFDYALEIEPTHADVHTNLGVALERAAWIKATSPTPRRPTGRKRSHLARRAVEISAGRDPEVLATLAAAYAEAGRFPEAISTLLQSIELAEARQKTEFADKLRGRLEVYRSGKPEYMPASPPGQKP